MMPNYIHPTAMKTDPNLESRIKNLLCEYVHCIDDERYEEWPSFFTENASYRITTRAARRRGFVAGIIDCESRGMMIDRVNSMRNANIFEPHTYRHLLGPTRIGTIEGARVKARTGFILMRIVVAEDSQAFLTGLYDDTFEEDGGELRICERIVELDSSRVDTLLVLPV